MNSKYELYLEKYMKKFQLDTLKTTIYILNITNLNPDEPEAEQEMPAFRYEKMKKYLHKSDRARHLGNELLFYYGLRKLYGISGMDRGKSLLIREASENGKPYIKNHADICFNMSHSGDYAVCAFSDKSIGVDIENIQKLHMDIAKRFYNKEEYEDMMNMSIGEQADMFYQLWVQKESFIKAVGLGLQIPLNCFIFRPVTTLKDIDEIRIESGRLGTVRVFSVEHEVNKYQYISILIDCGDSNYKMAACKEIN